MPSTFGRIETLFRGLQAQQLAVDTLNHNIANANTPGYSRQRVDLKTTPPYSVPTFNRWATAGQIGTGVAVASIDRVRDYYLDVQYRNQSAVSGEASAKSGVYNKLEVVFNEPNESGLSVFVDRFWKSWEALTNRPDDPATRAFVVEEGSNLAANINRVRQQIETQRGEAATSQRQQVDEVNQIARDLAELNVQITSVEAVNHDAPDLSDQRDLLLDRLAKLVNVQTQITPDGAVNVYIGGTALVDRDRAAALESVTSGGNLSVRWQDDGNPAAITGGTIAGLTAMHNSELPAVLNDLAAMRDTIADQVNAIHRNGYGTADPAGPPPNRDFFEVLANGDLQVRDEIVSDPAKIAAASRPGEPGNAEQALAIANVRYGLTMNGGTASIGDFYNAMVARIGGRARQATTTETNQTAVLDTIDRQRQQVSQVSLDEEAASLIKYQQSYNAAARAMTAVDQMLDRIINNMGLVGR